MATYVFDQSWEREKERLDVQAAIYEHGTREIIGRLGLPEGARVAEIGGGTGGVAAWLCDHVGPSGRVVATDLDTRFLDALDLPNLEVRRHNIVEETLEEDAYDLIHTRLVLMHLGEKRAAAIEHMVAALKPGGVLLAEDYDMVTTLTERHPPSPPIERAVEAIGALLRSVGADTAYGRKMPSELRAAGLVDVRAEGRLTVLESGEGTRTLVLLLEQVHDLLIGADLLGQEDFDAAIEAATTPGADGYPPMMVAAWGRKPG